jgi:hypothetical protein
MFRMEAQPLRRTRTAAGSPSATPARRTPPVVRTQCACGGGCPRCRSAFRGGATAPSVAQADSRPKLAQRLSGRWAKPVDVSGPIFNPCGTDPFFRWTVDFKHSLDIGYIVQRIDNTFHAENCDGTPYNGPEPTKKYWERWYVFGGEISEPKDVATGANDRWERGACPVYTRGSPCAGTGTSGNWAMSGTLYAVRSTDVGYFSSTRSGHPDAGNLEFAFNDPGADKLGRPSYARTIAGEWDCCTATAAPYHRQTR